LPSGALELRYCLDNCVPAFVTCLFAGPVDVSGFDVDFGNEGVLEVTFEVLSPTVSGKLHLNYGKHPNRKYVPLVPSGETVVAGMYRKYFTPGQAVFNHSSPICTEQCGSCPEIHQNPNFVFDESDLTLVAEGCTQRVDARVRLHSLRVVARGCGCTSNADCTSDPERSVCYGPNSGTGTCGWPSTASVGMCGEPEGCDPSFPIGSPCVVTGPGITCSGTWQCIDGSAVCEVIGCP
jgi:hypothetical protein